MALFNAENSIDQLPVELCLTNKIKINLLAETEK